MARLARGEKDSERGKRFRAIWQGLFPGQPRAYAGEMLGGISGGTIRNWELGGALPVEVLTRLEQLGVSLDYLLRGEGSPMRETAHDSGGTAAATPSAEAAAPDPKRLARIIGANLKHLRKQRFPGWGGQKKFADYLGLSANDLCVYEYGRSMPNEHRLEEIAGRLGLAAGDLCRPLPDVTVAAAPAAAAAAGPLASSEKAWRDRVDELKRTVARLEGRLEVMEEQNAQLNRKVDELQEANYTLRNLLYVDDTPEARGRRDALLERLGPAIADLVKRREVF